MSKTMMHLMYLTAKIEGLTTGAQRHWGPQRIKLYRGPRKLSNVSAWWYELGGMFVGKKALQAL